MPAATAKTDWALPRLIAHRGASIEAPENTLAAIARAADRGAGGVELDVAISADGVPVILHDDTLDRTTNGTGPVIDQPYPALAQLNAGSWFSKEFDGERLPTLAAAASLILDRRMALNLEIKPSPGQDRRTAERAIAVLTACWPSHGRLVLSSFSVEALEIARDLAPHWPRGLITDAPPANWREMLSSLDCASLHCAASSVTPSLVEEIHQEGYRLVVWTVNNVAKARKLLALGVDGIITDDPATMTAEFGA
ncbi:MAG: glycerophosphodiester phosphodiesterase [Rhodospirillaceae bacterium]|jgi:glycerophosphoryl diester phosphodiesterase|nr:glycerophosphodiester phosphodiesterase [Rhodospirillaceae bacterium]MBT5456230.1 glycerophosphodiester phosphodiesterase [Rhodospirillaceae bacterium]